MDDWQLRLVIVVVAATMTAGLGRAWRRRPLHRRPRLEGWDPGFVLFTSAACSSCAVARQRLQTALGEGGYREVKWEDQPELLKSAGVEAVPLVALVKGGRVAWWRAGAPRVGILRRVARRR